MLYDDQYRNEVKDLLQESHTPLWKISNIIRAYNATHMCLKRYHQGHSFLFNKTLRIWFLTLGFYFEYTLDADLFI